MDKIKGFFGVLKKQHFWILSGVTALVGLVIWSMASSSLSSQTDANKAKVVSAQSDVDAVKKVVPHPNETWVDATETDIESLRKNVLAAWQQLYDEQKEAIFIWPKGLQEDFIEHVTTNKIIKQDYRERYQNFIVAELERLSTMVDAAWTPTADGSAAGSSTSSTRVGSRTGVRKPGGGRLTKIGGKIVRTKPRTETEEEEEEIVHKVIWDAANQAAISQWFSWPETPSSVQVRLAQEDLWVYEALCKVIVAMNAKATGPHDATINEIRALEIGFDAAEEFPGGLGQTRIYLPEAEAGAEGEEPAADEGGEVAVKPTRPVGDLSGSAAGSSGGEEGEELDNDQKMEQWRYVDATGKPLLYSELAEQTVTEYRLMPFRMFVVIDQRELDRLLVEFRNSELPFEVRQVRVNPEAAAAIASAAGAGGSASFTPSSSSRSSGTGQTGQTGVEAYWVPVEVRGVTYLYNPPDKVRLGIAPPPEEGAEGEAATAEGEGAAAEGTGEEAAEEGAAEEGTKKGAEDAAEEAATEDAAAEDAAEPEKGAAEEAEAGAAEAGAAEEPAADAGAAEGEEMTDEAEAPAKGAPAAEAATDEEPAAE